MQEDITSDFYFCSMDLTREEADFVLFWKDNREKRRKVFRQLALGLPLGFLIVIATFVNFFSGWYTRAVMARNEATRQHSASLILVLLVAAILIVIFVLIFSVRHKWDINEQRYRELLEKQSKP